MVKNVRPVVHYIADKIPAALTFKYHRAAIYVCYSVSFLWAKVCFEWAVMMRLKYY